MHIVKQLMAIPGVIAAGEYAYRGDRFSYQGRSATNTPAWPRSCAAPTRCR